MVNTTGKINAPVHDFYVNKWFLDFTGEDGEVIIVYVATLRWKGLAVTYTSCLQHGLTGERVYKYRFRKVCFPKVSERCISWEDPFWGFSGEWESDSDPIQSRLVDLPDGYLDWRCYQPDSKVQFRLQDKILCGRGYVEQLVLTVPAWKIPMKELRWGRYITERNSMVWIELRNKQNKQWVWINGEKVGSCIIEDDHISIPGEKINLKLDRKIILESEKKIQSVVHKIVKYIPSFQKVIPLNFLLADEIKWFSNGVTWDDNNELLERGKAIHEWVNFNSES